MSKMKMPEMSVVHFDESDVIVASSIIVSNAGDTASEGGAHNLTITRNGTTILYNNPNSPNVDVSLKEDGYGVDPQFVWNPESTNNYSLSTLLEADNNGNPMLNVDGTYNWINGQFVKKQ